jgi:hypothetical protein
MEQMLTLLLDLNEQDRWGFCFQLRIKNNSSHALFIPTLRITGLQFAPVENPETLQWYTDWLVSAKSGGTTIEPACEEILKFRARPCTVNEEGTKFSDDWEYKRWCIRLVQGEYRVWYDLSVDETYFNPDSHLRYANIKRMAEEAAANLWCGFARSNVINVYYTEQRD